MLPTLDALSGLEECHEVESIFEIVRISLVFTDMISFDNFDGTEPQQQSAMQSAPAATLAVETLVREDHPRSSTEGSLDDSTHPFTSFPPPPHHFNVI